MPKNDSQIRLPNDTHRIAIVGRTGSGKTQAAMWHLSNAAIDEMPWVAINHKGDKSIDGIKKARDIDFGTVPEYAGIYRLHPRPTEEDNAALDDYLFKLLEKEDVGIYIDEGYMIKRVDALNACLTQGRSKHIPMIVLTQRPVRVSPFVFSECDFMQVFQLLKKRDKQTIEDNSRIDMEKELPPYHSYYYDVSRNQVTKFGPVPSMAKIQARIDSKLPDKRRNWL